MPYKDREKQKAAQHRYYIESKQLAIERNRSRRNTFRQYFNKVKSEHPCADCGLHYPPYVMDFDHVSGEKRFNISDIGRANSMQDLIDEIAKCEVVCANCHRHRTEMRRPGASPRSRMAEGIGFEPTTVESVPGFESGLSH